MSNALGICLGAASVSYIYIDRTKGKDSVHSGYHLHRGDPKSELNRILNNPGFSDYKVAITGRKYRHILDLPKLSEPEATERAYKYLYPNSGHSAIASLG